MSFDRRRPLPIVSSCWRKDGKSYLQMLSLYLCFCQLRVFHKGKKLLKNVPFILDSLDYEAQSWTDSVHILTHDALDDGSLSSIVKTPVKVSSYIK